MKSTIMKTSNNTKKLIAFGIAVLMLAIIASNDIFAGTSGTTTFTNKSIEHGEKITFEGFMGPEHGLVGSLVFDPQNEGVIYASNMTGRQIFTSSDLGQSWQHFYSAPRPYSDCEETAANIRNLKFANPAEPTHLYFTLNLDFASSDIETHGLYILDTSTGDIIDVIKVVETWHLCIADYDVDAANPDNIILYAQMGWDYPGSKETVWKTNDRGQSFEMIYDAEDNDNHAPNFIRFHPDNSNIIYMGMQSNWMGPNGGLNISLDGGNTWTLVAEGTPLGDIAFVPDNPNNMYIISDMNAMEAKVMFSDDAGETWSEVELDPDMVVGWDDHYNNIKIDKSNPSNIWITHAENIISSNDGGETWTSTYFDFDSQLYSMGVCLSINPFDSNNLLVSSFAGLISTGDFGTTWERVASPFMEIIAMSTTSFENGSKHLYYSVEGSFYIHNLITDEVTGDIDVFGWESLHFLADKQTENRVFSITTGFIGGFTLYMSDDNMETSTSVYSGSVGNSLKQILRSPDDENTYWFVIPEFNGPQSDALIFRTTDGFANVEQLSITGGSEQIHSIAAPSGQPGVLWAAVESPMYTGILKSNNDGNTWTPMTSGIPDNTAVYDISIDYNNTDNMVAATTEGIFLSDDGGQNWMFSGVDNVCINIIYSEKNIGVIIALDNQNSTILYSLDNGTSWYQSAEEDIFDIDYKKMDIIDKGDTIDIYLSTMGVGIAKYTLTIVEYFELAFFIQDEEGNAIENAQITLNGDQYESGIYNFDNLLPDSYSYIVVAEGYHDAEGTITITDDNKEVLVTMQEVEIVNIPEVNNAGIAVYPIPARTQINIRSTSTISELMLVNLLGQTVYSEIIDSNEAGINVSELQKGVYFLKIKTAEGTETRKIQVSK